MVPFKKRKEKKKTIEPKQMENNEKYYFVIQ